MHTTSAVVALARADALEEKGRALRKGYDGARVAAANAAKGAVEQFGVPHGRGG